MSRNNKFIMGHLIRTLRDFNNRDNRYTLAIDKLEREFKPSIASEDDDIKEIVVYLKRLLRGESDIKTAFVFGAGISRGGPFYLPNWFELLQNIVVGNFYNDCGMKDICNMSAYDILDILKNTDEFSEDFFAGMDVYEFAQYIENYLRERNKSENLAAKISESQMYEQVRQGLFRNKSRDPLSDKHGREHFKRSTLNGICDAIDSANVSRIITYNYDDAFEYSYNNRINEPQKQIYPVFVDDQLSLISEIESLPVYHVHGYTPYFTMPTEKIERYLNMSEARKLIMSERSYDDIAHSAYKWRNTVQIDTFLRYNCIFLGFSATDVNFKRIVKLMDWHLEDEPDANVKENFQPRHYILMCIDDLIRKIFGTDVYKLIDFSNCLKDKNNASKLIHNLLLCERLLSNLETKGKQDIDNYKNEINELLTEWRGCFDNESSEKWKVFTVKAKDILKSVYNFNRELCNSHNALLSEVVSDHLIKVNKQISDRFFPIELNKVSDLTLKIEFLMYILRAKRKYLKKYHIYPIWTVPDDIKPLLDAYM